MENQLSLSNAILAGIEVLPIKARCTFLNLHNEEGLAGCALGCVYAATVSFPLNDWREPIGGFAIKQAIFNKYPDLSKKVTHPIYKHENYTLFTVITELNDSYDWSREEIAQWLKTISL